MRLAALGVGVVLLWLAGGVALAQSGEEDSNEAAAEGAAGGEAAAGEEGLVPLHGERRDPFRPFLADIKKRSQGDEIVSPLQRFELRQLTVTAVMWNLNPPRALVQDSSGMGYIVTPGTPIGLHGGVVTAIEPGRVIVEEKTVDFHGRELVSREVLEIPKENEPKGANQE